MTNLALALRSIRNSLNWRRNLFYGWQLESGHRQSGIRQHSAAQFNFWMDPEAADAVLHANWRKITCTPVDISIKTRLTQAMVDEIAKAGIPLARYVGQYYMHGPGADFMWD